MVRIGKDGSRQVTGSLRDAKRELRELRQELKAGTYLPTRATRLEHYLLRVFLPWKRLSVKPKTYGEYQRIIEDRIVPALGHHRLQALSEEVIQDWVDSLWDDELEPKTIREYFIVLRAALKRATQQEVIARNRVAGVVYSQRSADWWLGDPYGETTSEEGADDSVDLSRVWTEEERRRFMEQSDPTLEIVRWIRLGIELGLGPQELCGLRLKDVSFHTGVIRAPGAVIEIDKDRREELRKWQWGEAKTGRGELSASEEVLRILKMQKEALAAEELNAKQAVFVFPSRQGGRPDNNPCNMKNRQSAFLNIHEGFRRISPYGLRHAHATGLLRHDWHAVAVASRLGTGLEMIAKHYGHLRPDAEAERLGNLPHLGAESGRDDEPEIRIPSSGSGGRKKWAACAGLLGNRSPAQSSRPGGLWAPSHTHWVVAP